jgi:hypothetical protein
MVGLVPGKKVPVMVGLVPAIYAPEIAYDSDRGPFDLA